MNSEFSLRKTVRIAATIALTGLVLLATGTAAQAAKGGKGARPAATSATATPDRGPSLGVYAGPAGKGVTGAQAFGAWAGFQPAQVLDFASTDSWYNITGPSWMLTPWAGQSARLVYSLPMMPVGSAYSLAACAAGNYNSQWTLLASNLVAKGLDDTIVRPGWEFNANWYHWSATDKTSEYIGCFRSIVTTMRAMPGQHFAFDWNPTVGPGKFPAELAYPGDEYVDYVGVDVYDYNWYHYPLPAGATQTQTDTARLKVWNYILSGDHGLVFWRNFAAAHGKPLSIPEWAVAILPGGQAGGDNPMFVRNMFAFAKDPLNNVAYFNYFEYDTSAVLHRLGYAATPFPNAATEFRDQVTHLAE